MQDFDVIILGGGAAGLMCAVTVARRGRQVLVLEGSNKIGKKILMSGGGRCNFTNLYCDPSHFVSANPGFCISALSRYTQQDFVDLVDSHSISYHEKTSGQLFCDNSSKDILAMLKAECADAGVEIVTQSDVTEVQKPGRFSVMCGKGKFSSDSLVVATGGLSIPKMGASDFGYRLARQFDLNVLETRAGLVPFTFTGALQDLTERLSGVSTRASMSTAGHTFTESILFTHRGLSGPAALQLSSYWSLGADIGIDLFPDSSAEELLLRAKKEQPKSLLRTVLSDHLPKALVLELQDLFWADHAGIPLGEFADRQLSAIAAILHAWNLTPSGTEGYRTAEVTLGGVDTGELSSKTMETRKVPGLFFIGEVVDVTGHLGGFNFQWAWASGYAAGQFA